MDSHLEAQIYYLTLEEGGHLDGVCRNVLTCTFYNNTIPPGFLQADGFFVALSVFGYHI